MMDKKQSNGCDRLRAIFIPVIMCLFMLATAIKVYGNNNNQVPGQFEKHVVLVFDNGNAQVKLNNAESVDMKLNQVPKFLKKNRKKGISRITLRYMYDVDGLADVQPLAHNISNLGIKISIANNDEMLDRINMPEYRCARIYDEGGGQYRFELNCHSQAENDKIRRNNSSPLRGANGGFQGGTFGIKEYTSPIKDLSITGDIELMKQWIWMFDGHSVGIYPADMPYTDAEQMAQAAWKRGINQVSMIVPGRIGPAKIVLIPEGSNWSELYPEMKATDVAGKREQDVEFNYVNGDGLKISNPKIFYNADEDCSEITNVINKPDELIVIYKTTQLADNALTGLSSLELTADGKKYRQTKYEGLNGFEKESFWSPDYGTYIQSIHFEPVPADVKTVDIYNKDINATIIKGLQVSDEITYYDNIKTVHVYSWADLTTTHGNESQKDNVTIDRIDLSDSETTIYLDMKIREPRSFMGYVGSDFVLTLHDGTKIKAIRYDGVPTDKEFDRNGDNVDTHFQVIFPAIPKDVFSFDGISLTGTVCHEQLVFNNLHDEVVDILKTTELPRLLEGNEDQLSQFIGVYSNLKGLFQNYNDRYLLGENTPGSFTLEQRDQVLHLLCVKEEDIPKYALANAYIIIYKGKNDLIIYTVQENGQSRMRLRGGNNGESDTDSNPYEIIKRNPNITVDGQGNWFVEGKKAVIWEIE